MIKVHVTLEPDGEAPHIGGESFWAEDKGQKPNQAEVCNIPVFADDISLGDIIEYRNDGEGLYEVVRVVKKVSNKLFLQYESSKEDEELTKRNFGEIVDYLKQYKFRCEGFAPGFISCAYDKKMSELKISRILAKCPHLIPADSE
jgi:hypothetical protein